MPQAFPAKVSRSKKRSRGRTTLTATPVDIRSSMPISPTVEKRMRRKLARRVGHAAPLIESGTVRFEDINGPRGGVDTVCRIELVLSGRPAVRASDRARDIEPAFDGASSKVQHALERTRGKHGISAGSPRGSSRKRPAARTAVAAAAVHRSGSPRARAPMKLKTARRPPSRKGIKAKARVAKHRVRAQRSR